MAVIIDLAVLIFANFISIGKLFDIGLFFTIPVNIILLVLTIMFLIFGRFSNAQTPKLKRLDNGAYILNRGTEMLLLEVLFIVYLSVWSELTWVRILVNSVVAFLILFIINLCGMIRIIISAKQVKAIWYVILILTWYIPVVNFFVLRKFSKIAKKEYRFEEAKTELNNVRQENQICSTKYPILMVHGIFFRDWQYFNYWGRVPAELIRNGAVIYYGKQQSANTIEKSAAELAEQIKSIIAETGAEKVNIIAHSKGGLDSRYAISCLGMDKYVASLTTINSPHYGCKFVDKALEKAPQKLADFLDRKYNKLFTALGDNNPSFLDGVKDLTTYRSARLNEEAPNSPNVKYHCVMSQMKNIFAAGFPLNVGYFFNRPYTKMGSDGLVVVESALYGDSTELIPMTRKRGISHGDMIDLFRENIDGFDVREFYVHIVKDLKNQGF